MLFEESHEVFQNGEFSSLSTHISVKSKQSVPLPSLAFTMQRSVFELLIILNWQHIFTWKHVPKQKSVSLQSGVMNLNWGNGFP